MVLLAITAEHGLSRKRKKHTIHLYHICKDMDALDRVRFNGLDYRMLRTQYARRLPLVAGCLLEEDLLTPLDMEFRRRLKRSGREILDWDPCPGFCLVSQQTAPCRR